MMFSFDFLVDSSKLKIYEKLSKITIEIREKIDFLQSTFIRIYLSISFHVKVNRKMVEAAA